MNKSKKISVFISFVLILLLAIGAASAADDAMITDDANLAAVDEVQAVDDTQISDEIYTESTDIVATDTGDSGDSDMISDSTGLQDVSDNGDEAVVSDNANPKNVLKAEIDSDEPLRAEPDGSFSDLNTLISNAADGSTITLDRNYVYNPSTDTDYTNGITIAKNITIDGAGFTIDGNNAARIFILNGSSRQQQSQYWSITYYFGYNYVFKNINFINAYTTTESVGAAITSHNYPNTVTISDCSFINNRGYAGNNGRGAISISDSYSSDNSGRVTITGCTFINNTAYDGGAIYNYIRYGYSYLQINNNAFLDNDATHYGDAIYFASQTNNRYMDIDENWWGQNTYDNNFVRRTRGTSSTAYMAPSTIYQVSLEQKDDDTVTLQFKLNNSETPSGNLPLRDATFSISSGTIDPASGSVTYGTPLDATFSITEPVTITATVDNQQLTISIDRVPITVTSADVTVAYPNTGSVTITASIAGTYNVKVGDTTYPVTITENGGTASVPIPLSNVGEYGISVTADLGNPYIPVDTGIINYYKVIAGSITVTGQGTTVTYPDKGTIVVNTDVAGAYTITIGDKTYENVELIAGANEFDVPDVFNAGDYDVKVSTDIPNYNAITDQSIATYTVAKATPVVSLSADKEEITYGESVILTGSVDPSVAGAVTYWVNGSEVNSNVLSGLGAGTYTVVAKVAESANYNAAVSDTVTITVNKATITVSSSDVTVTYPATGSVAITASVAGYYYVGVGGNVYEVHIFEDGGSGTASVSLLDVGAYPVTVSADIPNYEPIDNLTVSTYTVNNGIIAVSVTNESTTYPYTGEFTVTASVGGDYTVKVGTYSADIVIGPGGGSYLLVIPMMGAGVYDISVNGTVENYEPVDTGKIGTYTVNKGFLKEFDLEANATAITYGDTVSLSSDVEVYEGGTASGTVSYYIDGVLTDSVVSVDKLTVGEHTVVAKYSGDPNIGDAETDPVTITVAKATPVVSLSADKDEINFGESVALTGSVVPSVAGAVTYYLDGEPITGNVLSGLGAGTYTVVAKVAESANYNAAESSELTITVNPVASSVSVDPISFDYEASGSATATLTGATGLTATIEGYPDAVAVEGNVITVSGLPAGDYIMVVTTLPDANHIATSIEVAVTVNKIASTIAIDPISFAYGASGSATATLTGAETVTAVIDGFADAVSVEGNAITVSGLPAGTYTMVVTTVPDANHNAVSTEVTVTVNPVDSSVAVDPISFTYGGTGTGTAVLVGADTVTAVIDGDVAGTVVVEGNVITVSDLPAGTYTMVVTTVPDANHNAVSINVAVTVAKADANVVLIADNESIVFGDSVNLNYVLSPAGASGAVTYYLDGDAVEGNVLSDLAAGTYTVVAKYAGDDNFNAAESDPVTITVAKATPVVSLIADKEEIIYGESVTLTGSVDPSAAGTVTYYVNGTAIEGNVLSGLNAGTYTVVAKVAESDNYNAAESVPVTITVKKATITVSSSDVAVTYPGTGSVAITASVAGYYYVGVGGNVYEVHIFEDGGSNTASVSLLDVGAYPVTVSADIPNYEPIVDKVVSTYTVNNGIIAVSVTNESTTYPYTGEFTVTASVGGDYTVKVGTYSADIVIGPGGGSYLLVIPTMGAGVYDISVNGTVENYEPVDTGKIGTYTVNKGFLKEFDLEANATAITYGDTVSLSSNVEVYEGGTASGTVTYYIDGVLTDSVVSVDKLTVGEHTVVAKYSGDPNIGDAETDPVTITVAKATPVVSLSADKEEINFGESVALTGSVVPSDAGAVTYYLDGEPITGNVLSGLGAGTYTVVAKVAESAIYNAAESDPLTITVNPVASSVSVGPISFTYGESGTATATLSGATGVNAVIEGDVAGTVVIDGNVITVSDLPAGTYNMVVTTVPDANHTAVSVNVAVTVAKAASSVTVSADKPVAAFGEDVALSSVVSPDGASGAVTYYLDGEPITGATLSGLAVGTYTVVAKYAGDDNYAPSESSELTITVNPVASSVSVGPISFTYGESGTATATLSGATGVNAAIAGHDGAVSVDGATITVSGLPAGDYTMAVTTVPDANHTAVTVNVAVAVAKADANVVVSADKESIDFGDSVTLNYVLSPAGASGAVTYYLDGEPITGNVLSGLAVGTYTVVAKYAGDDNFNAADSNVVTITVSPVASSVSVNPISFAYGGSATATATLVGATGLTATIAGYPDAVAVNGKDITVSGLPAGSYIMVVTTVPDANHTAVSIEVPVGVGKENAEISLVADETAITYGKIVTLTATVSPADATGAVTYYVNDELVDSNVLSGLAAGTYTVVAKYAGNENYNAAVSNSLTITVDQAVPTVSVNADPVKYGEHGDVVVTVTGVNGAPLEGITVNVTVNEKEYAGVTGADGVAHIAIDILTVGEYPIAVGTVETLNYTAGHNNDKSLKVNKGDLTITAGTSGPSVVYGNEMGFEYYIAPPQGTTLSGDVTYIVDGTPIEGDSISTLAAGTHYVVAKYSGDPNFNDAESQAVEFTVNKAAVDVTVGNVVVVYPARGVISLTASVPGTYKVKVGDKEYTAIVTEAGTPVEVPVEDVFDVDTYAIGVTADESENYSAVDAQNVATYTVEKGTLSIVAVATPDAIEYGGVVELSNLITPPDGAVLDPAGVVTYYVDGVARESPLTGLNVGIYSVYAKYTGDKNFNEAVSATIFVNVGKAPVVLDVSSEPVKYGEHADVVMTVTDLDNVPLAGVQVYVNVENKEYSTFTDENGVAHFSIDILPVGEYDVVGGSVGTETHAGATTEGTVKVIPGDLTIVAGTSAPSVDYGSEISFTNTLNHPADTTTAGKVTYYVDGQAIDGDSISTLAAGPHTVVAKYTDDPNFNDAESEAVEFTVNPVASSVEVDSISFDYGASGSAVATLVGADAVTATIEGFEDVVTVNGKDITVSGLPAGNYKMVVTTIPDDNHTAVSIEVDVTVNKIPSSVSVDPISFDYGASATATATLVGADTVTATIEGYPNAVTVNGKDITVSGLPAGTFKMVVTTVPDDNHTAVSIEVQVGVGKEDAAVSLVADKTEITYGESVTLTATVSPSDATGEVVYCVGDMFTYNNVLSGLDAGTYTVYAQYLGDENYNAANSNSITITVNKATPVVNLIADDYEITYGESVTVTANVDPSDAGAVTYYLDGVLVDSNVLSGLAAGNHFVLAKLAESDNYNAAESNLVTITVNKATPVVSISASKDAYAYGEDVVLDVTVMDGETGLTGIVAVTIGDDKYAVEVSNGIGQLTVKGLSNGTYEANAKFLADDNYDEASASEPAKVVVNPSADAVITASVSEPSADGEATLTVNLVDGAGNPITGKVNVTVGDGEPQEVDVTEGAATIPLTGLALGENTIVVSTNDYTADPVTLTAVVPPKNTAELSVKTEDGNIVIEAKDGTTPLSGTATVVIDGGEPITVPVDDSGKATVPMDGLAPGQHTVEVTFANDNYEPVSEVATITVPKGTPTVTINPSKEEFEYGEDVVLNVAVMDGETGVAGTVIVNVGGNDYAVTVGADGTGQAVIKGLADNSYQATAKFIGNDNYEEAAAASAASFVVSTPPAKPVPTLSVTVDSDTIKESESATIKVSLVSGDTKLDGIVFVTLGETTYAVTVANGEGTLTVNKLAPGDYTVTGKFLGNDAYDEAIAQNQNLKVTKVAKVSLIVTSVGENIVIQLTDEDNNPVTGKVNVTIDGSTKEVDVNDGVATVPIGAGNHNVTVSYPGDEVHTGALVVDNIVHVKKTEDQKIKTKIIVNKNQTITFNKTIDNKKDYYVYATLVDANGNILVGKTVTFFAHKKLYVTKTNSKGQFRFSIAHVGYGECTHALTFVGDDDYQASFAVVCVTIKKQKVKLTSKARTFKATKKVKKLTATLKNSKGKALKGKKITFIVNGKKYTAKTNAKGVATVKIKVTKKKTYKVKVQFAGDKTYAKKTVNRKLKIT